MTMGLWDFVTASSDQVGLGSVTYRPSSVNAGLKFLVITCLARSKTLSGLWSMMLESEVAIHPCLACFRT